MSRPVLLPVLAGMLLLALACASPPATVGIRAAGDVAPEGTTTVGGSVAVAGGGPVPELRHNDVELAAAVDVEHSVRDWLAVTGAAGLMAGQPQLQAGTRFSTRAAAPLGVAGDVGWAATGFDRGVAHGPYVTLLLRARPAAGAGFLYAGSKLHPSFGSRSGDSTTWLLPAVGWESEPGRAVRVGAEVMLVADLQILGEGTAPGGQIWVEVPLSRGDRD